MDVGFRNRRRLLRDGLALAGLGLLAGCGTLPPQPSPRPARVGVITTIALDPAPESAAFRAAQRDLGYVERQNLTITFR